MARTLSRVADFLQKSITFACLAGSVYILVFTGKSYLALRQKRLANAASIETQKELDGASPSSTEQISTAEV